MRRPLGLARSARGAAHEVIMSVQYFSHVGICVSDLERSIRFYRDVLGFELLSRVTVGKEIAPLIELDGVELHSRFLERDGSRIELLYYVSPTARGPFGRRPMNQVGLTHLAIRVDDVESLARRIEAAGGKVWMDTRVGDPAAGVELVYATDPDGTRIELIQVPGDPAAPPGEPL
jgi:lactoylglutathione lyase